MTLVTLRDVLQPALKGGYAVPGLVCLGWEDARAFVAAAEAERAPVILQAGPGARAHMPVSVWGAMFRHLAEGASVPVVAHLDHGTSLADCRAGLDSGFSSVMFDGSDLPLAENIDATATVAALAHAAGASCEGEIGFVGYAGGAASAGTDPEDAARFARETGVDAMAISIGNLHLQQDPGNGLDLARLRAIEALTDVALVIHGGSGVPFDQRAELSATSHIAKFNIGTELRMVFGAALRAAMARDANRFDRNAILTDTHDPMQHAAQAVFRGLGASGRA
ncbi:MAG: class II fructose-bisphosphate aldolase [Pseudotabrizicola sp.]|uniref:class II fructose-bisphosphate aldolase n=1 Tax=Pseudotabrizicola sp. TaxID=2939647 RepID=UPI00272FFF66|nr:class II fructose-bisphosphate aldolase [Pseudotabrizicola sp.]MDP2081419.1 class II fructose-bisphosphate aldolase [Pseudotabrizicola sp.]MDZ7572932.1 class II fructose-bisphosphate aldolase [Pseudotabrizicola sp.]